MNGCHLGVRYPSLSSMVQPHRVIGIQYTVYTSAFELHLYEYACVCTIGLNILMLFTSLSLVDSNGHLLCERVLRSPVNLSKYCLAINCPSAVDNVWMGRDERQADRCMAII